MFAQGLKFLAILRRACVDGSHCKCLTLHLSPVLALLLALTLPVMAADNTVKPVALMPDITLEKRYQQALYAYFQGDVLAALSHISALEQRYPQGLSEVPEYLRKQDIEPELLKGALSLSYGLQDQATEIFQRLLSHYYSGKKRTQAWFLLGLTYYRQEQWQKASEAFTQISASEAYDYLDVPSRDQWVYLQAQLGSLHNRFGAIQDNTLNQQSDNWQQSLSSDSIYHYYLKYNQALATLQAGNLELATEQLDNLINKPNSGFAQFVTSWFSPLLTESSINDEEQAEAQQQEVYGVLDRAKLTLGYVLLQQGKPEPAYRVFSQIRREGLDGDAAVLGYGWAAAKSDELQTALGIWQNLIAQSHYSEYSLEAYLASSYAYEKAYAPRQSVAILTAGVRRFNQALAELNEARQQINQRPYLLALARDFDQNQPALINPTEAAEKARALTKLVNHLGVGNEFRYHLAALQQTQLINSQLSNWQQRMANYHLMLDEREEHRAQRAQTLLQNQIFSQLPALVVKRDALAQTLTEAEQQGDTQILMPYQYQQWQARLKMAQQRVSKIAGLHTQLQQQALKPQYSERLARINGTLIWLASEAYADNRWQAQKALAELDQQLTKTSQQQQQLMTELQGRPDFALQRQRVVSLSTRIGQQLQNNQDLQSQLITKLSAELSEVIDQHMSKVNDYIMQAELAMVRLNDQALQQNQAHGAQLPAAEIGRPPQLSPTSGEVQPK